MKKYHINYAHIRFFSSQKKNSQSAIKIGGFDESINFKYEDIDEEFVLKNNHILSKPRGVGYWIWKPYIIFKMLEKIDDGDVLFYTDSGCLFKKSVESLIKQLSNEHGMLLFELDSNFENKKVTKRDCFYYMNLDYEPYLSHIQILASFVLMTKNDFSKKFVKEWLDYSQDYRIITDSQNECGYPNYQEFIDHRHDQSILSLLARKYNVKTIPDISQFGNDRRSLDGQIINHTRV